MTATKTAYTSPGANGNVAYYADATEAKWICVMDAPNVVHHGDTLSVHGREYLVVGPTTAKNSDHIRNAIRVGGGECWA